MSCGKGFLLVAMVVMGQIIGSISYDLAEGQSSAECDVVHGASECADSMLQLKRVGKILQTQTEENEEEEATDPLWDPKNMRKMHDEQIRTKYLSHKPLRDTLKNGKLSDWLNSDVDITPLGIEAPGPCPADAKSCMYLKSYGTHIVPNPYEPYWHTGCNTKTLEGFCKCTGTPSAVGNVSTCLGTCLGGCAVWWQDITVVPNVCHKYESLEACKPSIVTAADKRVWPPKIVDNSMWKSTEDGERWCNQETLKGWCKCSGVPAWEMTTDAKSIYRSEYIECKQHNKVDAEVKVIDFHPRTAGLASKKIPGGTGKCKWYKTIKDCAPIPYTPSAANGWHEVKNIDVPGQQSQDFFVYPEYEYQKQFNNNKFGPHDMIQG